MSNDWSFLNGMRIIDLSRLLPGPMTTQLLADLGAEVIKIEEPIHGDTGRVLGKEMFARLNRNKSSLTLNLKTKEGNQVLTKLIESADALVESFRPGVMDRLGFSYADVKAINPKLVYCSLSGYGQTGPYAQRAGHDIDFLALAGYFGVPSQVEDKLARPKIRLSDYAGAMYAALSLSVAMASSKQNGKGQYLDVAIMDAISAWTAPLLRIAHGQCEGNPDKMPFVMPDNDIFQTKDGHHIALGLYENKFWTQLVSVFGDEFPTLVDERYATKKGRNQNKQAVYGALKELFASRTKDEWHAYFEPTDMPWAPVYEDMQMFDDEHVKARGLMTEMQSQDENGVTETSFQVRYPVKFSEGLDDLRAPPPNKGQNNESILQGLGYSMEQIADFSEKGAI